MIPIDEQGRASAWLERVWLARYLDRELSDDEAARFEAYVLDKPDLLAEIDADTSLRDTLAAAGVRAQHTGAEPDEAAPLSSGSPAQPDQQPPRPGTSPVAAISPARRNPPARPATWLALAASLLVGLGVGALLRGLPAGPAGEISASPARLVFDTMRGAAQQARWEEGRPGASDVIVDIAVAPDAQSVVVKLPDGTELALTASAEGFATFVAPRAQLAGRKATLKVTTQDGRVLERELEFGKLGE